MIDYDIKIISVNCSKNPNYSFMLYINGHGSKTK